MPSKDAKRFIGIDLGTTYCSVAVIQYGVVKVVEDEQGNRCIPSYVAFTDTEYLVGFPAHSQAVVNPSNTVYGVKRLLGRKFDDPEVTSDRSHWPFSVINDKGRPKIKVMYKFEETTFCPEEITAMLMVKMKEMSESYTGISGISYAVISVPANFNYLQRKATMNAARIAGLNVLQLINEPTAAALAYFTEKKITDARNLLVFDLGGGSFDISFVSIQNGKLEVKAVFGDSHLGGEDFDNNMLSNMVEDFKKKGNIDTTNNRFLTKLKNVCEKAKKELSQLPETRIQVEGSEYLCIVNRDIFNMHNDNLYKNILDQVKKVLLNATINTLNFDILLVGGSTRMSRIDELLKTEFSGVRISKGINRDEAVAYGAAVQAAFTLADKPEAISHLVDVQDIIPKSSAILKNNIIEYCKIPTTELVLYIPKTRKISDRTYENHVTTESYSSPSPQENNYCEVTIAIDANGILTQTPTKLSRRLQTILYGEDCISEEDIEKMRGKANKLKEDLDNHNENMRCRNSLEGYIFRIQSALKIEGNSHTEDNKTITKCREILAWLRNYQEATVEELEIQRKRLENIQELDQLQQEATKVVQNTEQQHREHLQSGSISKTRNEQPTATEESPHVNRTGAKKKLKMNNKAESLQPARTHRTTTNTVPQAFPNYTWYESDHETQPATNSMESSEKETARGNTRTPTNNHSRLPEKYIPSEEISDSPIESPGSYRDSTYYLTERHGKHSKRETCCCSIL